ncbi:MAG: AraC family transcriptional regulator [Prevotella sp.]|nr:AraC family transcriptional regulator [Prevotella sp.]
MMYANILSAFFIGVLTAFFTIISIIILFFRKERTRFQRVLGYIMAVWAVWSFKDIIIILPNMYDEQVLRWILLVDGWSALTFTVFIFEATLPGWTTLRRLTLLSLPFLGFTVWYAVQPQPLVIISYIAFLWCYAWLIVTIGYFKFRRYIRHIRSNYSNLEGINLSWLKPVFFFAIFSQLAWLFTSLYATVFTDVVYYLITLLMWLVVLHYSWHYKPITIPDDDTQESSPITTKKVAFNMPREVFIAKLMEHELYLDKDLTLTALADALQTNRTYLSQYLSGVCHQTFYDCINELRIQKKSIPLMHEHPEYTLDYIAAESGFCSISTFRRAFHKFTGTTPSQFILQQQP